MKKILSFLAILLLALSLGACKKKPKPSESVDPTESTASTLTDYQELIDEVKDNLEALIKNPDAIVSGFQLPTELANNVIAAWSSGDSTIMTVGEPSDKGIIQVTVIRPEYEEGHKKVKLTATLTLGGLTDTWEIELTIRATDPPASVSDKLGESVTAENAGKPIVVNEVAVYAEHGGGFYVSTKDGEIAYVHGKGAMPAYGKLYKMDAVVDNYYNSLQIKDVNFVEMEGVADHVVPYKEISLVNLIALPMPSPTNVYGHPTFKLKDVKIIIDGTGNYNTFIVDKDFKEGVDKRTAENSIMLYYHAQIDELRAIAGLVIEEIDLVFEGWRSDLEVWYFSYVLPMNDIKLEELSDEEIVTAAKAALALPVVEFPKAGTVTLPIKGNFQSNIAWSFKNAEDANNALVNLTTGAISMPDRGRVAVTIVATITFGEATETKEFTLFIGEFELETIADAIALNTGLSIMIKGVITNKFANGTYGMQDGTHSLAIYSTLNLLPGYEYVLVGKKDNYNGLHQLKDIEVISERYVEMPQPVDITHLLDGDKEALYPYVGALVLAKGLEVSTELDINSYGNITFKAKVGEKEYEVRYDSRVTGADTTFLKELKVGDKFDLITNLGWFNNPQFGYGPVSIAAAELVDVVVEPREELPEKEAVVDIADFLLEADGYEGTIVAVVTSLAGYSSFSVEDATGAVAFRVSGLNSANADFKVGDVIVAKVKKTTYNGLIQAELVKDTEYEVIEGNFLRLAIVDLTAVELSNENILKYQSRAVDLDSVEVKSKSVDTNGNISVTIDNKKGKTVVVRWDARVPGFNSALMDSLKAGDIISIQGASLGWFNGPQIAVDQTYQIVLVERAPEVTPVPTEPVGPTPVAGEMIAHYDFGTTAKTGYAAGDLTWENTDGTEVTASKDRVQINTSTFAPHNGGQFLVMSVRDTHKEAWINFDFNVKGLTKITLEINVWNNTLLQTVKDTPNGKLVLQVKVGNEWVDVNHKGGSANMLPLLTFEKYVEVEFTAAPGQYRLYYYGESTVAGNTTHAVTVDNIKLWA